MNEAAKPLPPSAPMFEERRFTGIIRDAAAVIAEVVFSASVNRQGVLVMRFEGPHADDGLYMRLRETQRGEHLEWLQLDAHAEDGTRLRSSHFEVRDLSHSAGPDGLTVAFGGSCAHAELTLAPPQHRPERTPLRSVRFWLRGLECSGAPLKARIAGIGSLIISCRRQFADEASWHDVSGMLVISQANGEVAIEETDAEWCERAKVAGEELLLALSFACGTQLAPRVIGEYRRNGTNIITVRRTTELPTRGEETALQVIPDWSLQAFLHAVILRETEEIGTLSCLQDALSWLVAPSHFAEVRLFCAVTAIENLIARGLSSGDGGLLSKDIYQKAKSAIQEVLKNELPHYQPEVLGRLLPRNEKGLREKLECLLRKWGTSADHLPPHALRDAITARNQITHRGVNTVQAASGRAGTWSHAMVFRELAVRLILARFQYRGPYLSFVGRYHQRVFPACIAPG
ncbi:hypothetical protein ACI6QG_08855 [Roseococcus sp. DSY-14]|uniref:hypothetical protein n=1 Tax=Roseococcus sp. DSY-14 TaxID=3369650 RepID=UPI00387B0C14